MGSKSLSACNHFLFESPSATTNDPLGAYHTGNSAKSCLMVRADAGAVKWGLKLARAKSLSGLKIYILM